MFQPMPSTPYDLKFTVVGIPVRVHPMFWIVALLLGATSNITQLIIWVIAVFVSILLHELGHALVARIYNEDPSIVLYHLGGLAISRSASRTPTQQIIISLAGPFAGFLLAAMIIAIVFALGGSISVRWLLGFIPLPSAFLLSGGLIVNAIIGTFLWINVFWGLINLLPVFPLDGGQVSQQLFIMADPWNGVRNSLWLSVITGGIIAIASFVFLNSIYMALLFGLLAFQSYQILQGRGGRLF